MWGPEVNFVCNKTVEKTLWNEFVSRTKTRGKQSTDIGTSELEMHAFIATCVHCSSLQDVVKLQGHGLEALFHRNASTTWAPTRAACIRDGRWDFLLHRKTFPPGASIFQLCACLCEQNRMLAIASLNRGMTQSSSTHLYTFQSFLEFSMGTKNKHAFPCAPEITRVKHGPMLVGSI